MATQTLTLPEGEVVHLGRIIPKRQKFNGGYFFVQLQDDTIETIPSLDWYYNAEAATVPLPEVVDWTPKAMASIKMMYGNDQQGDCVIASAMHQVGMWTGNDGDTPALGTTQEALSTYHSWCGRGDNGCNIASVLKLTQSQGVPVGGVRYKIDGFVSVDNTNKQLVMAAMAIFGSLKLGVDLPSAWRNAPNNGLWDITNSGTVGGHDIPTMGYDSIGVTIATWAGLRKITWPAFLSRKYITECYLPLSPDWYGKDNLAPNGIDAATLKANLDAIKNGQIPPFGPPPQVPLDWLI